MEAITVKGLVLKQTNYSEADKILTIFTDDLGIVTVIAKGARKIKSHQRGAASLFCYGEYVLYPGKNMYTMRGAKLINSFYSISESIEKLALASYLCEITAFFIPEEEPCEDVLSLVLNTLYILSEKDRNLLLIKAVFEFKFLSMIGYQIDVDSCINCGKNETVTFSAQKGGMLCSDCSKHETICPASCVKAIKYITLYDTKNIFSFTIDPDGLKALSHLARKFTLSISEYNFPTDEYFYSIIC